MSRLRRWWTEPDRYEWTTEFLRQRGLRRPTQLVMATVASSSALVAVSALAGLRHTTAALFAVGMVGAVFTTGMTAFWLLRWPTRHQSEATIIGGTVFIAVWSIVQPSPAVSVLACTATAVTGGYIAFFHGGRMLAFNFVVAVAVAVSACWRLVEDTDVATAVAAFWLIWFLNLCVPVAIRALSTALSTYATRSDSDPLTGLLNRRGFFDAVDRLLSYAQDGDTHLSLVMVDLDDFKLVNDTHGHAAGDKALLEVADLLRRYSPGGVAICRAGGEEFFVALLAHRDRAGSLAVRFCSAIAALPHDVTASIGVSSVELDLLDGRNGGSLIDELIATADAAMYVAKRNGGNQVQVG